MKPPLPSTARPALTHEQFAAKFASIYAPHKRQSMECLAFDVASASPLASSELHGMRHWLAVRDTAVELLAEEQATCPWATQTITLFALFHDCARTTEGRCVEHGKAGANRLRAADLNSYRDAYGDPLFSGLVSAPLARYACEVHTLVDRPDTSPLLSGGGFTRPQLAVIGICLDADRLDLPRVGTLPNPAFMASATGKRLAEAWQAYGMQTQAR